jgi:hypothetical protein
VEPPFPPEAEASPVPVAPTVTSPPPIAPPSSVGASVAVASEPPPGATPELVEPPLPSSPLATGVPLPPSPFDWHPGARRANAARAAPGSKRKGQRNGLHMGTSLASESVAIASHSLLHRGPGGLVAETRGTHIESYTHESVGCSCGLPAWSLIGKGCLRQVKGCLRQVKGCLRQVRDASVKASRDSVERRAASVKASRDSVERRAASVKASRDSVERRAASVKASRDPAERRAASVKASRDPAERRAASVKASRDSVERMYVPFAGPVAFLDRRRRLRRQGHRGRRARLAKNRRFVAPSRRGCATAVHQVGRPPWERPNTGASTAATSALP